MDAQRIAEEKARELAVANSLVAEKTREYTELQRIVTDSEQSAAGMDEKFKSQLLETKQERCGPLTCLVASLLLDCCFCCILQLDHTLLM